jgi:hypothetical protein
MMSIENSVTRSMLAAVFIWGGLYTLRNPKSRVEATKSLFDKTAKFGAPISDANEENLVELSAAVMVSAGGDYSLELGDVVPADANEDTEQD